MDNVSKLVRHKTMSAVKSNNTGLEAVLTKKLWKLGFRFRKNVRNLLGKPDIAIKKYKVVIFIDSCFWHGCDLHCRMPSSNYSYWSKKIQKNKDRDEFITNHYYEQGWKILRVWEHEIKDNMAAVVDKIADFLLITVKINRK